MRKKWLVLAMFVFLLSHGFAQYSNLRSGVFAMADSIVFDTLPVIENSLIVRVQSVIVPDASFSVDYKRAVLVFANTRSTDSVTLVWRILPPQLSVDYFHKNIRLLQQQKRYKVTRSGTDGFALFQKSEIDRSGSVSRGFTMGNNQDVTMNSSLNLQLSGKLTDNLSVVASITDANIPVQPDGNTQQLQEFDQIFIRVYNDNVNLIVGDYNLERPTGTFLNVNKKLQGIQFENRLSTTPENKPKTIIKNSISGAVSKGKYFRMQMEPIEGNQGPYKLKGANNERFIIVIAGSERVIVDGETLQRGEQYDYTIDYNSAEVRFNPTIPITNDMRIYVEFEYTDKNYTRFLVADYAEVQRGKTRMWMNVISESDSKNQPIDIELTSEMTDVLAAVGDDPDAAVVPNITEQEYDNDMILYAKRDSVVDGIIYEVYYQSTNVDSAIYRLGFSLVGSGNGNYAQTNNLANGKTYRWFAPVAGVKQGSYEPVVQLVAPQSQQMITAGVEMKHSENSNSKVEMAWSRLDKNTFSSLDANDDVGAAINYEGKHLLMGDSVRSLSLFSSYQYVHANFNSFERFRSPEFDRDWNVRNISLIENQHVAGASILYNHQKKTSVEMGAQLFVVPDLFEGLRSSASFSLAKKWAVLSGKYSFLSAKVDSTKSDFLRAKTNVGIPFWKLEAGLRQELEVNKYKNAEDKMNDNSYQYFVYEAYVKNRVFKDIEAELAVNYRIDYKAVYEQFESVKERKGITLKTALNGNKRSTWQLIANYRQVLILNDSVITSDIPDQHVSARLENRSVLFDGIIRSSTFYEVTTGLESKKDYAYIPVEKGQGNYIWVDRNSNDTKEINEFEIAQIASEGDHIRMYIPTDEYISVYANQFKQTLNVNFRKWTVHENGMLRFLSRFSNQLSYAVSRKVNDNNFGVYANPFLLNSDDSILIATTQSVRNMFSFNKIHPKFGADFIYTQNVGKNLLTSGFEGRGQYGIELQTRWNMTKYLTLLNNGLAGNKKKSAQYFTGNNYKIANYKSENTLRIQPASSYRFEIKYTFDQKNNLNGTEKAEHHDGGIEFNYAAAQKSTLELSFHYIDVAFNGEGNNSLTYEMLNGLQKGANYTWEVQWNKQLAKSFQMSITYNGRAGDDTKTIHIGTMRVRAMF